MAGDGYKSIPNGFETVTPTTSIRGGGYKRLKTAKGQLRCSACKLWFGKSTFYQRHRFICQGLDERGNPLPGREPDYSTMAYKERFDGASSQEQQAMPKPITTGTSLKGNLLCPVFTCNIDNPHLMSSQTISIATLV